MPTRRRLLQGSAMAAACAALPRPGHTNSRAADPDLSALTLRVGTYRGLDATILPGTGQDRAPYRIQYDEFSAGNLITQAINAGALDYGTWSEIPLVFAAAAHASVSVVGVMQGPTSDQAVVVPAGSTARSIADLRGRRVGYVRATTAHYFLLKMLAQHGLGWGDIEPVAIGISAGLTAMKSGALDAWATYGYAIPTLQAETGARVLQNAVGILSGNYLIGVDPRRLDDPAFRAMTADYIRRMDGAYRILAPDKPRWAKLVAPAVGVTEPIALAYLRSENEPFTLRAIRHSDIASAQDVADTFSKVGLLPGGVQVAGYFSDALSSRLPVS